MKYYVVLAEEQKEFLSVLYSEDDASALVMKEGLDGYIEHEILDSYCNFLISYIELELYKKFKVSSSHEIAMDKKRVEVMRIEKNCFYMPLNMKLECLIDIACHTDYNWMDKEKVIAKAYALSEPELILKQEKKDRSFGIKSFSDISIKENKDSNDVIKKRTEKVSITVNTEFEDF